MVDTANTTARVSTGTRTESEAAMDIIGRSILGIDEYGPVRLAAWIVSMDDSKTEILGAHGSLDEAVAAIMDTVMDPERPEYSYQDGPLKYSYVEREGTKYVEIDFGDPLHVGQVSRS